MATKKTKKEAESTAPQMAAAQTQTEPTGATQPVTDLNIGDLRNVALIIDVASTRGAFRANEMATVGLIYNKLQSFLAKMAPEAKTEDATKKTETPAGK